MVAIPGYRVHLAQLGLGGASPFLEGVQDCCYYFGLGGGFLWHVSALSKLTANSVFNGQFMGKDLLFFLIQVIHVIR